MSYIMLKLVAIILLCIFYIVYLGKMIGQKRRGIQTDQIAKGKKPKNVFLIELVMKIATYLIVVVEVISILGNCSWSLTWIKYVGIVFAILGDLIFAAAVFTMKDSWRAGIPESDKTAMVTSGIYQYSRNPAFLGFDLVYLGILLMYFNGFLLLFTMFAIVMLHLQILQEEKYLKSVFGEAYIDYQAKVMRYFGKSLGVRR